MHDRVFREFEEICFNKTITGSVLEVGAIPSAHSLLCMRSLDGASEKVGVNLDAPYEFRDFKILKSDANYMDCFEDERFDVVLCNALIEHDKYFWKTISEIKRVTKKGGLIVIGAPGYRYFKLEKIKSVFRRIPLIGTLIENQYLNLLFTATITYQVHNVPCDYYRFSPQAFKEVIFEGIENCEVRSIMVPPRIIGFGVKRQ